MKRSCIILVSLCFIGSSFAKEYNAYWLCANKHLQEIQSTANVQGKNINLFVNYNNLQDGSLHFSKIDASKVDIPAALEHGNYIMLGNKGEWMLNCVGQVIKDSNSSQPRLVFDVSHNAFGCQLVPKGCEASDIVLLNTKSTPG